jgi:hypothetical protein
MSKSHILILIVLLAVVCWFAYFGRDLASSLRALEESHQSECRTTRADFPTNIRAREARPHRPDAEDALAGVKSALARRYLRFMLPGWRLDGQSHDQSIVNNAFTQAWGVTARIDLSEEQQDRLAEFLLEKDWTKLTQVDPNVVEQWAREHLTDKQRVALLEFIEESKQGELALSKMRLEAKMREYGAKTPEEASYAEMLQARRIAELMSGDTANLSPEELESRKKELKELMEGAVRGWNGPQAKGNDDRGTAVGRVRRHARRGQCRLESLRLPVASIGSCRGPGQGGHQLDARHAHQRTMRNLPQPLPRRDRDDPLSGPKLKPRDTKARRSSENA